MGVMGGEADGKPVLKELVRGGEAVVRSVKKLGVRLSAPADRSGAWGRGFPVRKVGCSGGIRV